MNKLDDLIRNLLEAFDIHADAPLALLSDKLMDDLQDQAKVDAIMAVYNYLLRFTEIEKERIKQAKKLTRESIERTLGRDATETYNQFLERVIKGN